MILCQCRICLKLISVSVTDLKDASAMIDLNPERFRPTCVRMSGANGEVCILSVVVRHNVLGTVSVKRTRKQVKSVEHRAGNWERYIDSRSRISCRILGVIDL